MNITKGRGNKRRTMELPCGYLVASSAKENPKVYNDNLRTLCGLLGVPHNA